MAEKWITKTKKVKGETIETQYRIDADFKPSKIGEISMEFIENYCVANNAIDWLLEEVNITTYSVIRDKGKPTERKEFVTCDVYPFVNLRRDFAEKFFSSILIGTNDAPKTWKDRLNEKYGKK
jgi:hypothetical protein